jgi:hypothetical protein
VLSKTRFGAKAALKNWPIGRGAGFSSIVSFNLECETAVYCPYRTSASRPEQPQKNRDLTANTC